MLDVESGQRSSGDLDREPVEDDPGARRLEAIETALTCNHPTAEIEQMLAEIERGRDAC